jgi:hypothetical protein
MQTVILISRFPVRRNLGTHSLYGCRDVRNPEKVAYVVKPLASSRLFTNLIPPATYRLLGDYAALIDAMIVRENTRNERITALEAILETLSSGYNPNYQDMAVLEAVRGWAALKLSEEPKGTGSTAQEDADTAQSQPPDEEELIWTDERILKLKDTDALSALLEHERHISSPSTDDFSEECTLPIITLLQLAT